MKFKDLKIGTQLKCGFAVILLFVAVLGITSYFQTSQMHLQIETMYQHPLQVRRALWEIKGNILNMRMNIRDLLLNEDGSSRQLILNEIAVNKTNVLTEIEKLREIYLGPKTDIDDFSREFTKWVAIRDESIRLIAAGRLDEAKLRHQPGGIAPVQAEKVLKAMEKISIFSLNKANELHKNSEDLYSLLNMQLGFLVGVILLFSLFLMFVLSRNIRKPLEILGEATRRFRKGDLSARSLYESGNEFGVLSSSFNKMAESVQTNAELDQKTANLASLMLSKYDPEEFFKETITSLAGHTNSQIAAVYLLSEDKRSFRHFESIGADNNAKLSFPAVDPEGEFGAAIFSRKIQHIKNIDENTRFAFHTVSGKFIPNEIITIPIIADKEAVAIISLASTGKYSSQSIKLIDNIFGTLCARVEGVLIYSKIKNFLKKLEDQNRELEAQKNEMAAQSAELVEQNTELEMQKRQLDEANRLKTIFLSNMSHELRTPLNSVIALSGVLNRRLKDKVAAEEYSYIDVIERNGKQLLMLINDILDLSRIEAGRENIDIREFSPCELLREVAETIEPQAVHKNISLKTSCDEFIPHMWSDYEKCRHILQNIVANAVKFTDKGGVEVSAVHKDGKIQISVTDTGIGIDRNFIPHIFDEFRQADGSNSRKYGGTGLGMAIAKRYSEMLGGIITVESTPGVGSCFTLTIPLNYSNRQKTGENAAGTLRTSSPGNGYYHGKNDTKNKTILLVEDTEPVIIQMEHMLSSQGYKIMTARNGAEALEQIAVKIPDAMILDLMMPEIDGFEVLKTIREKEKTAHLPVIILTAKYISKEELSFLKYNSIHQVIQKGDINKDQLLKAVGQMMFPETKEKEAPQNEKTQSPVSGTPVVLIVEDNPDNMITIKALLDGKVKIIEAETGISGIELAKKHRPDLILMDIALPGMNGIEALKEIKKDAVLKKIPAIAVTASAMKGDMENLISSGFDSYISKPIDEKKFREKIQEALYGKK